MALDSLTISILATELRSTLVKARVTKVYQPEKDEIHLLMYGKGTFRLLLSANASLNRMHLVAQSKVNPVVAPTFCMLLRKHLTNATLIEITQMPYERVVDFAFEAHNELGYCQTKHLIFELTGKTANIILTDQNYIIFDTLKHLPISLESSRILIAGTQYKWFADRNLLTIDDEALRPVLENGICGIDILLRDTLMGVSAQTLSEVLCGIDCNDHSKSNVNYVMDRLAQLKRHIANPQPNILFRQGSPEEVYPFDFVSVKGEKVFYNTLNEAHEQYFVLKDKSLRFSQRAKAIHTSVKNGIARLEKKIALQRQDVLVASEYDKYRIYGDLILANIHTAKGDTLNAVNYYEENCPTVDIPLDANKTPQQNAQDYYKKYHKQKNTVEYLEKLVQENQSNLQYLNSIAQSLKTSDTFEELDEIHQELIDAKLIRGKQSLPTRKERVQSAPLRYRIDGMTFLVGKNNAQNDTIVRKLVKPHDIWFHTHNIHSAHGLLITDKTAPTQEVITRCAEIVTHYSEARYSGKTTVDYTLCQNLSRPPKSPLGFVVYTVYQTIIVHPNAHMNLLEKE